jgi:hypothetical protein
VAQVQQRLLNGLTLVLLFALEMSAQRFYPDDPISREPRPLPVTKVESRKLSEYYDFFLHTFATTGEKQPVKTERIRARALNTLGEVLDGAWYTNRHGRVPMTLEQLRRGPGIDNPPSDSGPYKVLKAKTEGITPGFDIEDSRGERYMIKVDPMRYPNMATAADVIGAKFFHALGYHVPEYYVAKFSREQLIVSPNAMLTDATGKIRKMTARDIDDVLFYVPRYPDGRYRAVASRYLKGRPLGPFRYFGVRKDDPNDVVPHEHRRELRGLFVFSAWLGHNDVKSLNDLDTLAQEDGIPYVKHHLLDFGAAFGSDSFTAKSPRAGNQYMFAFRPSVTQIFTLGLYVPRWARAHYPNLPEVGNFESDMFDPEKWLPNYPNPAFDNRLPEDTFWAARQVMAFRDDEIRAIVETGEYSDPRSVDWITKCLIVRRDKIGRTYFAGVLPLDDFQIRNGQLVFEDLAVKYGFSKPRQYLIQWSRFDNAAAQRNPLTGRIGSAIPDELRSAQPGEYYAAEIRSADSAQSVVVYVRAGSGRTDVVGIHRTW